MASNVDDPNTDVSSWQLINPQYRQYLYTDATKLDLESEVFNDTLRMDEVYSSLKLRILATTRVENKKSLEQLELEMGGKIERVED